MVRRRMHKHLTLAITKNKGAEYTGKSRSSRAFEQ